MSISNKNVYLDKFIQHLGLMRAHAPTCEDMAFYLQKYSSENIIAMTYDDATELQALNSSLLSLSANILLVFMTSSYGNGKIRQF